MIDPARGAFVKQDLRYSVAEDATTKSTYLGARAIEVPTNLSTTAQSLAAAAELLAFYKVPYQMINVSIEGVDVADMNSFDGSPPVFDVEFSDFGTLAGGSTMLPTSVAIDYQTMTTTLTLRG